ncbi:hypothetical protein COOONC_19922 [Cooperia oncophora]
MLTRTEESGVGNQEERARHEIHREDNFEQPRPVLGEGTRRRSTKSACREHFRHDERLQAVHTGTCNSKLRKCSQEIHIFQSLLSEMNLQVHPDFGNKLRKMIDTYNSTRGVRSCL